MGVLTEVTENSFPQKKPHTSVIIQIIIMVVFSIIGYYIFNSNQASDRTELDEALKYRPLPFSAENDYIVEWSDTVLETRIREQLGKEKGGIYLSALWDYNTLYLVREPGFDDPGVDAVGDTIKDIGGNSLRRRCI